MRIRILEFTHIIQTIRRNLDLSYHLCMTTKLGKTLAKSKEKKIKGQFGWRQKGEFILVKGISIYRNRSYGDLPTD